MTMQMKISYCLETSLVAFLSLFILQPLHAQNARTSEHSEGAKTILSLSNDRIRCRVILEDRRLNSDEIIADSLWARQSGGKSELYKTDADFGMEIMWTDWQAPTFVNNAENPVTLTKKDFLVSGYIFTDAGGGKKDLILSLTGADNPLQLRLQYELGPTAFYVRRALTVIDTAGIGHFLQVMRPTEAEVTGKRSVIKPGGFGQPVVLGDSNSGVFFGVEFPAADNRYREIGTHGRVTCSHEVGELITQQGVRSEWVVEGLSPNSYVKQWFMRYVDDIRIAPLKPYTLYNSWYDLRSPEYPRVPPGNVMNEKNVLHIIDLMKKNMIEKHGITLDAFVLDDGWDQYDSDWKLGAVQFPNGLKPISEELKKTDTKLGLWFGPIGGYSFRSRRVGWMKNHGYEVVGDQMCVAGARYSALLKKRVTDFASQDGVAYYKWDGIQFSCSEPDHGHPVGIYSRRAMMKSVIDMCNSVRAVNPEMFLNITSGTWLSPWWVQYANQIWMQGEDYGYADVPSISPRDAAITYRDLSLYEDFKKNNFWFPIQNLMTHGIIKGNLEKLGGEEEPLDKFTNEVVLYLARGVSMWELYISPDILTDGEWNAMAGAIRWAKDRFDVLSTTEMVGGDPKKRETYGYVHFKGNKGIIAARNPWIERGTLRVDLSAADGLSPDASGLVLEKVYPEHVGFPELYKAGSTVTVPLQGYETAVYELRPLKDYRLPLVAGVPFNLEFVEGNTYRLAVYGPQTDATLLNPSVVKSASSQEQTVDLNEVLRRPNPQPDAIDRSILRLETAPDSSGMDAVISIDSTVHDATLAVLLTPDSALSNAGRPQLALSIDGKSDTARIEKGEGASTWYRVGMTVGKHRVHLNVVPRERTRGWKGRASAWIICSQLQSAKFITVRLSEGTQPLPMPPRPYPPGVETKNIHLGTAFLKGGTK